MGVIELIDRPQAPLFHIEHYIDGEYIKYNSNSGFVDDRHGPERMTPQALSHFTFERSGHQLVVVDIQGVGDLYTDPQIHTAGGSEYGDGNLGTQAPFSYLTLFCPIVNEISGPKGVTHHIFYLVQKIAVVQRKKES